MTTAPDQPQQPTNDGASAPPAQAPGGIPGMGGPSPEEQWLASRIQLRSELRLDLRNEHEGLFVVIEDPVRNRFFSVGSREYEFLSSLDGERSVGEIVDGWTGKGEMNNELAVKICQWATNSNLVHGGDMNSSSRLERQSDALERQKWMGILNPISMKFKLFNPDKMLAAITPALGWAFSKTVFVLWLLSAAFAMSLLYSNWSRFSAASIGIFADYKWLWMLVIWVLLKIIHEIAHGVACKRYGGTVNEAGVLLLLFTPMAFVNVTSSWRFANRFHRIVVAAAGMYVELFISFLAIIVWAKSPDGVLADICYNIFIMASVTTILFNANPLMRFDGYYMLADSLGVTNMYTKGTKLFGDKLKSLFFGVPPTPNVCPQHEKRISLAYGTFAFFWKILISISLIIGASVLFYGAGKLLAIFGVALFFGMPILAQYRQLYGAQAAVKPKLARVVLSSCVVAAIVCGMFFLLRAPATKSAAALVQFKNDTPLRAETDGFVDELLVTDGQAVEKGQPIVRLRNPEIDLEIVRLESEAEAAKIQARIYKQSNDMSLSLTELEKLDGIKKQLAEKRVQAKSLEIVAPFDGFVFQRNLDTKIGSFAKQGDTLVNMAQKQTKEIVVSIDQRDWESLKGKEGSEMRVVLKSLPVFKAKITRIDPRATDVPIHASMCAAAGGPLAIVPGTASDDDEQPDHRLLTPHFTADLQLDAATSEKLKAGQRGRAFFQTRRQSLGSYLFLAAEDWLRNKIDMASQMSAF